MIRAVTLCFIFSSTAAFAGQKSAFNRAICKLGDLFLSPAQTTQKKWLSSPYYLNDGSTASLILNSKNHSQKLPIEFWSQQGNPIVKIPYQRFHYQKTQSSLPLLQEHLALNGGQGGMLQLTRKTPIIGHIKRSASESPTFVIVDGHHRFFSIERDASDFYAEIFGIEP